MLNVVDLIEQPQLGLTHSGNVYGVTTGQHQQRSGPDQQPARTGELGDVQRRALGRVHFAHGRSTCRCLYTPQL
ncbi:hypothetical protein D3C80_1879910 [compost metagenome]